MTESQVIVQRTARAALRELSPLSAVREWEKSAAGYDRTIYRRLASLGWIELLVPNDHRDVDRWIEAALIYEELGRSLFPSPLYATTVCARLLAQFTKPGQRPALIDPMLTGDITMSPAFWERSAKSSLGAVQARGRRDGDTVVVDGEKRAVDFGHAVDRLLVAVALEADNASRGLAVIDRSAAGVEAVRIDSLGGEPRALVRLSDVRVAADHLIPLTDTDLVEFDRTLRHLGLLRAAELLGVAGSALELAVTYANARTQYGRPVGAFQAVQHKLANCAIRLDLMRLSVSYAAWLLSEHLPSDSAVAEAVLKTGEMAQFVTAEAVQTHGGLGVIDNSVVSVYFRRAKSRQAEQGFPDVLRERIAIELGL
ncbi:MAG: acyl-CoA dehydrogenase family protein [Dehalococcoidia bacterium]